MAINDELIGDATIVAVHWHHDESRRPLSEDASSPFTFCVCFDNGMILLSRGDSDANPLLLKSHLKISHCSWSYKGDILAICGSLVAKKGRAEEKDSAGDTKRSINVIQFYDSAGAYVRTLRVPGEHVASIAWECSGLRVALAVDSLIFFANVRPAYQWASVGNTIAYAYK